MNSETETEVAAQYRALGHHIRRLRLARGASLRATAHAAGVDTTWLSRLEQGVYASIDARRLVKLARALGTDVEELYVAGGLASDRGLPGLQPYLRAKYDLPPDAIAQLQAHFELLNDKHRREKGDDHDNNSNPA